MVSVNIDDKLWIPFLEQSTRLRISASKRIRDFISGELLNGGDSLEKAESDQHKDVLPSPRSRKVETTAGEHPQLFQRQEVNNDGS